MSITIQYSHNLPTFTNSLLGLYRRSCSLLFGSLEVPLRAELWPSRAGAVSRALRGCFGYTWHSPWNLLYPLGIGNALPCFRQVLVASRIVAADHNQARKERTQYDSLWYPSYTRYCPDNQIRLAINISYYPRRESESRGCISWSFHCFPCDKKLLFLIRIRRM